MKTKYRFDEIHIQEFSTDKQAFNESIGWHDDRGAIVEKLIAGVWHDWDWKAGEYMGSGWVNPKFPLVVSVGWSYPTSTNAVKFGFAKTGCWTVSVTCNLLPPVAVEGYTLRSVAMLHAVKMGLPFEKCFKLCNPGDDLKDWFTESQKEVSKAIKDSKMTSGELVNLPINNSVTVKTNDKTFIAY